MKAGIHKDIPIDVYHADKTIISSTGLKKAKRSTRDFVHYVLSEEEQESYFDFGNAFEIAVMDAVNGTDLFAQEVAIMPTQEWRQKALDEKPDLKVPALSGTYKNLKAAFDTLEGDKYIIDDIGESESKAALDAMIASCVNDPVIAKLLKGTEYQVSLVWKDAETGLMCKTRPDICKTKRNVLVDIKTCRDASPGGFSRDAANLDYPLQATMQIRGAMATGLMPQVDNYFWLAVEKTPPYNVALYEYQKDDMEYFTDVFQYYLTRCGKALDIIKAMKNADLSKVQSYGEGADNQYGILPLEIPLWYRNQMA